MLPLNNMVAAMLNQRTRPTLSESPIDWRMDIQLHQGGDNGYSSDGRSSAGRFRFRLGQPRDNTGEHATEAAPAWELQRRINDLTARIEYLENRLPSPQRAELAFDADVEPEPVQDAFDDPGDVADAEPPPTEPEGDGPNLSDLPRGPLSIEVVARTLCKTARTIRGWCQVEKYEIPAHKEAGNWRFYRDELMAWYVDYEAISRRDAKRAQTRRRKTKHGKQKL